MSRPSGGEGVAPRVLISYAHDNSAHEELVRNLWVFLRGCGIDATLDLLAGEDRQNWPNWMSRQLNAAKFVLVIASKAYKVRAEGHAPAGEGLGVGWEARMLREWVYKDPEAALRRIIPVVLPDCDASDLPDWLAPYSETHYEVSEYTEQGADKLLRLLLDQPFEVEPPLGRPLFLKSRTKAQPPAAARDEWIAKPVLRSGYRRIIALSNSGVSHEVEFRYSLVAVSIRVDGAEKARRTLLASVPTNGVPFTIGDAVGRIFFTVNTIGQVFPKFWITIDGRVVYSETNSLFRRPK